MNNFMRELLEDKIDQNRKGKTKQRSALKRTIMDKPNVIQLDYTYELPA